jgi:multidrug efflux pump subunit AcrA (membrane-fusion protein)
VAGGGRLRTPDLHHPMLSLFGRVEAPDRIRAATPVAGRLLEAKVRDGDLVPQGALLARIDPADLEPELAQARAELARARLATTLRRQSIAEHPARLALLQARLAEAERDASRAVVKAPFAARIGKVEAGAGDQLQANQTILTLYPVDGLYVRAKVPCNRGEELRSALAAGQRLSAQGRHAGRPFTAVLKRLAGEADARGVDALLKLDAGVDLPLGAFVDLALERPAAPDTIALPFAALNGGSRVFAIDAGRLRGLSVERVGERVADGASEVLVRAPGLRPGARGRDHPPA